MLTGRFTFLVCITFFLLLSCNQNTMKNNTSAFSKILPVADNFNDSIDGKNVGLYIIKNDSIAVAITNYGARVVSIIVPDDKGNLTDVSIGFDSIAPYTEGGDTYFGAIVGRYGNRIAKGKFSLGGKTYQLATNNGQNHLHGGIKGFSRVVWNVEQVTDSSISLTYLSKSGEEGYPGNLEVKVRYSIAAPAKLEINYEAKTDEETVVNLTNHTYFNLNGEGSGTINDHIVMINADKFTPVDSTLIPTGAQQPVEGTPFDFRTPKTIASGLADSSDQQLRFGNGFDHNFILNTHGDIKEKAAEVTGNLSGIIMDIYTMQPGLQFYGGNFMDGSHTIKNGKRDDFRTAFCMETQHFPDSPNQPAFPSTILKPGETFRSTTIYSFSTKK